MRPLIMTPGFGSGRAMRCLVFDQANRAAAPQVLDDFDALARLPRDDDTFVWLDLALPSDDDLAFIKQRFGLSTHAIEDVMQWHERPKVEPFDDYLLVIAHAASLDEAKLTKHEIALFVGERFAITLRAFPLFSLAEVDEGWRTVRSIPRSGPGLLFHILDVIVDGFSRLASRFQDELVDLESHLFDGTDDSVLQRNERAIFRFKRTLTLFRALVVPMRDVMARLISGDAAADYPALIRSFRDVQDHLLHAIEEVDTIRDLLNSTYDLHLSLQSNRDSQVNKQLTVIATIFLPITFVTGFFGQNFSYLADHIAGGPAFWWLGIGTEVVTLGFIWAFFKRRGWI